MYRIVETTAETEWEKAMRDYYREDGAGIALDLCNGDYMEVAEFETKDEAMKALENIYNNYGTYVTNWGRKMFTATEFWVIEDDLDSAECTETQNKDWLYAYDYIH